MTSSSSSELLILQDGESVARLPFVLQPTETHGAFSGHARTRARPVLVVTAPAREGALRVRIGEETALVLAPSRSRAESEIGSLLTDLFGEATFSIELDPDDQREEPLRLLTASLRLEAPPEIERLYETIIHDLEEAHLGLARDLLGRSTVSGSAQQPRKFDPELERERLQKHLHGLIRAVERIGVQPSTTLRRELVRSRFRPGEVLDARAVDRLLRDPDLDLVRGRLRRVGRIVVRRPRATTDLPEHRHLAAAIRHLARRADALAHGCRRAVELLAEEERRWGVGSRSSASVFEQRYLPRIRRLRALEASAKELHRELGRLIERHEFLALAPKPRTRFGPTPLFIGHPVYREAFEILREAGRDLGPTVDGQEVRFRLRGLDTLYEYWVFVSAVAACRECLGPTHEGSGFHVIHDVYRPDLLPGQFFEWRLPGRRRVRVYYEPAIPQADERGRGRWANEAGTLPLRASLVGAPLRPDVLILDERPDEPARAVAIDAKNTTHFRREQLFEISDYRTLVHDPATGHQPIRALFLVHRTADVTFCSLPGFFQGREAPESVSMLGAFPLVPENRATLTNTIRRLLKLPAAHTSARTPYPLSTA